MDEMEEKNPLLIKILALPNGDGKTLNKRGRPTAEKAIRFGPQPKSMVVQMLHKKKLESLDISHDNIVTTCSSDDVHEWEESTETKDITSTVCSHSTEEQKKQPADHKQYSCDYPSCTYSCKLSSNLIKHKRVHTGEKPYLCDRCSFRSNFINSLKAHKRIHTSERPYQCQHCSYKCNSSSNLKKHCFHRHHNSS